MHKKGALNAATNFRYRELGAAQPQGRYFALIQKQNLKRTPTSCFAIFFLVLVTVWNAFYFIFHYLASTNLWPWVNFTVECKPICVCTKFWNIDLANVLQSTRAQTQLGEQTYEEVAQFLRFCCCQCKAHNVKLDSETYLSKQSVQ